ncbi:SMP-30/gluconolactonase/LRE family protein [Nocardioides bizhenqiangii]|uniref:SMP-30/gluconolactonase/LRE family protein n=1 Tax=Nocardioides bizhenqiangii TaxID=3095076 RepID=A0ABZ0ZP04_9ACTN|nr:MULTISPECIES: SMP-30/gluconolactonase/LRE family protein [unclassified Nocardioides]MDZ5621026.1 SMP-30/gluconolactonase/LRE family protein [Nocardioides sp. HM23]WQQ25382.1 SMP-30/gluconolactonase/LRE family protein [Nocardioides sp. HM61]
MTRKLLFEDLAFGESPRWHDGRLYLSDVFAKRVVSVGLNGSSEVVVDLDDHPSGLGWLPDGRMLVVSMLEQKLLRLEDDKLVEHADLSELCPGACNDMVVDGHGRAYVGNAGYPYRYRGQPVEVRRATSLVLVHPDGRAAVQPGTLMFPNGAVVSSDGDTLVVAQSHGARLTAYDIDDDGTLRNERVFAALPSSFDHPDGICMDAEGGVWMAQPEPQACVRVVDGGQVTHVIDTAPWECIACMLGGEDGRTLFLVLSPSRHDGVNAEFTLGGQPAQSRVGRVELQRVDIPGAGWP